MKQRCSSDALACRLQIMQTCAPLWGGTPWLLTTGHPNDFWEA